VSELARMAITQFEKRRENNIDGEEIVNLKCYLKLQKKKEEKWKRELLKSARNMS
jgi:hypothetical protein